VSGRSVLPAGGLRRPPPAAAIEQRIDAAWSRPAELAAHLPTPAAEVAALAERNFEVLDELVTKNAKNMQA